MSDITLTYIDPEQQGHEISYHPEEYSHSRYGALFYSHKIITTPSPDKDELEAVKNVMAEFGLKRNTSIRNTLETWMSNTQLFSEEIEKHYDHTGELPLENAMDTAHYNGNQVDEDQVANIEDLYQNYDTYQQDVVRAWWSEEGVGEPDDTMDFHYGTYQSQCDAEEELAQNDLDNHTVPNHLVDYVDMDKLGSDLISDFRVIEFEGEVFLYS